MIEHQHGDLSDEDRKRISDLFNRLDRNKDGKIDIKDLTEALHHLQVPTVPGQAQISEEVFASRLEEHLMDSIHSTYQQFQSTETALLKVQTDILAALDKGSVAALLMSNRLLDQYDHDKDGHIEFADFVKYVLEQEHRLRLNFHELDHNKDGYIDADEIMVALKNLGVNITRAEAERLLKKMDKDETLLINWNEWRDYLLFHPSSDICDIVHYWRHAMIIDVGVGEDTLVPDDFTETELQTGMWWRHLVAGGAAGAVSRTCTAPLDRLKVLLQAHGSSKNNLGIRSGFNHMLKEGGIRSLWRGNGINVLKIAPETAIKFAAYEQIKRLFKNLRDKEQLGATERFISGSMAGAISQSAIYPMEVLKTRLALRKTGQYKGISDCAQKIYAKEGVRSFYRGYVPNLIGIIPYAGIDLCVYETLKRVYTERRPESDPGVFVLLACGTASSTCGQLASYPLALVRTKLQAKVTGSTDTMFGLFKSILRTEGPRGLYRGLTPNFMKVIPAVSISYVVYEHCRKFLGIEMT